MTVSWMQYLSQWNQIVCGLVADGEAGEHLFVKLMGQQ